MSAPAYTYSPQAEETTHLNLGTGQFKAGWRPAVRRSDGVVVYRDPTSNYAKAATAKMLAGRIAKRYADHLSAHGECFHDVQMASLGAKRAKTARIREAMGVARRAVSEGFKARREGRPITATDYEPTANLAAHTAWRAGWLAGQQLAEQGLDITLGATPADEGGAMD